MDKNENELKLELLGIKISLWVNVAWGIAAAFACFGFLIGRKETALAVSIVIALSWVLTNMVSSGMRSYQALSLLSDAKKEIKEKKKENSNDEDET